MHLNSVQLIGRVGKNGPKLSYATSGAPTCTFTLEVDEVAKSGDVFTLFLPVELWGHAEVAAETLEAGDEVMLSGRLKYKSVVDAKTQAKVSKLIISSWGVQQRQPAMTSPPSEYKAMSDDTAINHEPASVAQTKKARKPSRTRASMLAWAPEVN